MKKKLLALLLAIVLLAALTVPALAAGEWNNAVYRVNDYTGQLTDDQVKELDDRICSVIDELECDYFFCIVTDEMKGGQSLEDYGDSVYAGNDMGYGGDKTGVMLLIDNDSGDYRISTYGEARTIYSDEALDSLGSTLISAYRQDGLYPALGAFFDEASRDAALYRGVTGDEPTAPAPEDELIAPGSDGEEWNASLYRINDYCELLSEDEVIEFDTRICSAIDELKCDFVFCLIPTEKRGDSTLDEYNDVIYETNGMGYGSDRTGIMLTIDNDTNDYHLSTYGEARTIFSEEELTALTNELVGAYQRDGLYYALNHFFDNASDIVRTYRAEKGSDSGNAPAKRELPDWYPEDVASFQEYADPNAAPLRDDAEVFTEAEEAAIEAKLRELRAKYGADFCVFTDKSSYGFDHATYSADYYIFNRHGVGDDLNGMVFFLCMEPGNRGWYTNATGSCQRLFDMTNIEKIDDRLEPYMVGGRYGEGVLDYLDSIDTLFRTGRAPKTTADYAIPAVIGIVAGLIVAGIVTLSMRAKMKTVAQAVSATDYLARGSFNLTRQNNTFLYRNVTRTLRQTERSSGGGGGSYGGHSSSSSGHSFSGGGRSF